MRSKTLLAYFFGIFILIAFSYYGLMSFKAKSQFNSEVYSTKRTKSRSFFSPVTIGPNSAKKWPTNPQLDVLKKSRLSEENETNKKCRLPPRKKFLTVQYFVLFIGYSRSGSTLVGSLLDAHPDAIIANEYFIVDKFRKLPEDLRTREYIFDQLLNSSVYEASHFQRSAVPSGVLNYHVPNQWQGKYNCSIKIIGDKKGAGNSRGLKKQKNLVKEMQEVFKVPIKFIHVYRNPYDNIATMVLRQSKQRHAANSKSFALLRNDELLKQKTKQYLSKVKATENIRKRYPKDVFDVDYSELMKKPTRVMSNLCKFFNLFCSKSYLTSCRKKMFKKETFTRDKIKWTNEIKSKIADEIRILAPYRKFQFDHKV